MFRSINKKQLTLLIFFLASFLFSSILVLVPQEKAKALWLGDTIAGSYAYNLSNCWAEWENQNRISIACSAGPSSGVNVRYDFVDSNPNDSIRQFVLQNGSGSFGYCPGDATISANSNNQSAGIAYGQFDYLTKKCTGVTTSANIPLNNPEKAGNVPSAEDEAEVQKEIDETNANRDEVNNAVNNNAGATDSDEEDFTQGCEGSAGPFSWLLCGVLDMFDGIYNFIQQYIRNILLIDESVFDTSKDGGKDLYQSWASVRNIANALIAISALIIIASQIFGFEILSAYTVKKALPRILIAAIGIQVSWIVFTAMISLVNAIGIGLHDLLIWPFVQNGQGTNDIASIIANSEDGTTETIGIALAGGVVAGGVAVALSGAWLTLALALLGAIVSIIVAIFVLLVRSIIIVILVVLAPIAIAAWVIPGTQTWWKVWWETFSKLLLMFPLIMALFAAGTIGANIIGDISGDDSNSFFNLIAKIVVYFAPLFLITATYKFAGNIFGKIVNFGNKAKGESDKFGWFGARDRAKASREHSTLSQIQANRKENLNRKLTERDAQRITGEGKYSKGVFRRGSSRLTQRASSGILRQDENAAENLTRAQARAGVQIAKMEKENFENMSALADYQITSTAKRIIEGDQYIKDNFDLFTVEQQVRAARLAGRESLTTTAKDKSGNSRSITVSGIQQDERLNTDIALQALKNKDNTTQLNDWLSGTDSKGQSNFTTLKDRGTVDPQAWSTLVDKLAPAAKGATSADLSVTTLGSNGLIKYTSGFTDTVKNFAGNAPIQQEQTVKALRKGLTSANQSDRVTAAGLLQDIVKGPKIDQQHIDTLATILSGYDPSSGAPMTTSQQAAAKNYAQQLAAARSATATVDSTSPGNFTVR